MSTVATPPIHALQHTPTFARYASVATQRKTDDAMA